MAEPDPAPIFDAFRAAAARGEMPTALGTAELRELGAGILSRAVFCAHGANAVFVSKLKEVVDAISAGDMDEATARVTLLETLRSVGYTPEGGFPDTPPGTVPPALKGTLQDLSSFRRLKLIVETQRQLMQGAGLQFRGHQAGRLQAFPAWELVRIYEVTVPRNWNGETPTKADPRSRWVIAGGTLVDGGRMIALKGDPIWGELGSYDNFSDALGVDHPPFAFNSGMGWREVSLASCLLLGIKGPNGEAIRDFHEGTERPRVMAGELPLPDPVISVKDVDPKIVEKFQESTGAIVKDGKASFSERQAAREARRKALRVEAVEAAKASYQASGKNWRATP